MEKENNIERSRKITIALCLAVPLFFMLGLMVLSVTGVLDGDLFKAIKKGDIETVRHLVEKGKEKIARHPGSLTALHQAAYYRHVNIAEILIENGADVNAKGGRHNFTPIFISAYKGDNDFVKFLLDNGADVNITDDLHTTPLMSAAEGGNLETVKLLINYGADIRTRSDSNKNALDYAKKLNNEGVVKYLQNFESNK